MYEKVERAYRQSALTFSHSHTNFPGTLPDHFAIFPGHTMILLIMAKKKGRRFVNNCPTF